MKHPLLALLLATTAISQAYASPPVEPPTQAPQETDYSDRATGNWNGARNKWENAGITLDVVYKLDLLANTTGGIKSGTRALDNLDVVFGFDGEKLLGAKGLSAKIHFLNNFGGHPDADLVGSAQGIDNIEVPDATAKIYQAYVQQNLWDDRFSILAGLYDVNSEFYVTDSSALFIHSTFGIGTDIAQSGAQGPSIFPFTSAGSRVRIAPTEQTYIQAAILDGVSGDTTNPRGTQIDFDQDDGWLTIAEAGFTPENSKIAIGGWYYTQKADHLTEIDSSGDPIKKRSEGAYIIGETQLYEEAKDQGLMAFARFGFANGEVNQFNYAWSAGLVYTGLIPTRDEGQLGFGITGAHNSSEYKQAAITAGTPADSAETTFELTYSDNLTPWLAVQPDVQYIINPGTDKSLDNALVVATRFTINF